MNLPYMTAATGKNRKQIIAFAGLNYGQGAGDGELAESWGLSSARFPCLSQRDGRKTAGTYTSPTGLYARGKLCVVDGTDFLYDGNGGGPCDCGRKAVCHHQHQKSSFSPIRSTTTRRRRSLGCWLRNTPASPAT